MEKVTIQDGESANIVNDNIQKLKEIFPEAFTEGSDGKTVVQFGTLKQLLDDENYP